MPLTARRSYAVNIPHNRMWQPCSDLPSFFSVFSNSIHSWILLSLSPKYILKPLSSLLLHAFPLSVGHHPLPPLLQYNTLLAGQSVLHIADEVIIFKYKSSNISLLLNFFSGFPCHSETTTTKPAKLCTMNCKALHDLSCLCFQPHLMPLASTHSVLATRILFQFNSFAKGLNCLRL